MKRRRGGMREAPWDPTAQPELPFWIPNPVSFDVEWDGYGLAEFDTDVHDPFRGWMHNCRTCWKMAGDLATMAACPHHRFYVHTGRQFKAFVDWLKIPSVTPPHGLASPGYTAAARCAFFGKKYGVVPRRAVIPAWPFPNVTFDIDAQLGEEVTP